VNGDLSGFQEREGLDSKIVALYFPHLLTLYLQIFT
jgi:hypothetical protein